MLSVYEIAVNKEHGTGSVKCYACYYIFQLIADSGINLITYSGIDAASDANRLQQSLALAEKYGVEMPIVEQVNKVLFEDKSAKEAVLDLIHARTEKFAVST